MLLQLLRNLRLDLVQLGQLGLAHVVQADHVPAKLALHRGLGHLALAELDQGFREFAHIAGGVGPVQIAALGARAWVFGLLLGDIFKLGTLFDGCNDGFGIRFLVHQDVAGLVFLAAVVGHELVVLGLDFSVGHGVVLLVVGEQFADQDGLAGQLHLRFVVGRSFEAALLGFLQEDFAGDHFFLDLTFHFRGDGAAGPLYLLAQNFGALFGHGLAIHDGKVLGGYGQGHRAQHGSGHEAGQELFLHAESKK